jgi:hypothetical protein
MGNIASLPAFEGRRNDSTSQYKAQHAELGFTVKRDAANRFENSARP